MRFKEYILESSDLIRIPKPNLKSNSPLKNSKSEREGNCYQYAATFIIEGNDDWSLVHGYLIPDAGPLAGTKYYHAWCIKKSKNQLYDPVFNNFFDLKSYYNVYQTQEQKIYDKPELMENLFKFETWGPW